MSWESLWQSRSLASHALLPASWLYGLAVRARGAPKATRVEGLTVVSVGNLIAGGAGKTPVVIFLAEWALRAARRVAIISRGYGRNARHQVQWRGGQPLPALADVGDEPGLIARRFASSENLLLIVDADRIAAARTAREAGCDWAILDDGFQHRRLHRDVNILIDAGIGNARLLPAGPLREPVTAAARADVIWARDGARALVHPPALRVEAIHETTTLLSPDGREVPRATLAGQRVVALAGLARPSGFLADLRTSGANVVETHLFPDHHRYSAAELDQVRQSAVRLHAVVVTTEKDRERLPEGFEVTQLRMAVRITQGQPALAARLGLPTHE